MRVIERRHRLDCWNEDRGTWVELSDGQRWLLPRPYLTLNPVFKDGEPTHTWMFYSYPPDLQNVLDRITAATNTDELVLATVALGAMQLRANYRLTDQELGQVLCYRVGDPASQEMLREFINVATGGLVSHGGQGVLDDPKRQSAGPGSPSSPADSPVQASFSMRQSA